MKDRFFTQKPHTRDDVSLYGKSQEQRRSYRKREGSPWGRKSVFPLYGTCQGGKVPGCRLGGGANPPAPDWTSAHPEGVFRALPPSSGRRLRPRSPSPVPWRRRWRRRSKMKTATAAAGICASWTKACGGKGRSAARSGPRIPLAGAELYPDRAQMLSGFLPPYCAGTALLKCQVHRVLIPFLLGLLRAWKLPCILCQSLAILRLQWFFLY